MENQENQNQTQEECTHDCSSCSQNCASRDPKSLLEKPHEMSHIRKVIAVVSGVGKIHGDFRTGGDTASSGI